MVELDLGELRRRVAGAGVTDVTPLAAMYGWHRAMRLFDGPDEVHLRSIARAELNRAPEIG